jgi:CheY-like chemotaxis protein
MSRSQLEKIQALVVDDFDSFRVLLSSALQELGVTLIDVAASSGEALRFCASKSYDIILCDQNLGPGKSGRQLLEDVRYKLDRNRDSFFVLISADTDKNSIMAALDDEPDAYLTKPITGQLLKQRLGRLLSQRVALASVYSALKKNDTHAAVEKCVNEIKNGNPHLNQCQKMLGKLLLGSGRASEAEHLYQDILQLRRLDWAMFGMAKAKELQGNSIDAEHWLNEAIDVNPHCFKAYDSLAGIFGERGQGQDQQEVLEQALSLSPLSVLRQQALGDAALKNNDILVAANAFRKVVKLSEHSCHDSLEAHVKFARATIALASVDKSSAKPLIREALQTIAELPSRFGKNHDNRINSYLLEAQLLMAADDDRKSKEALASANKLIEKYSGSLSLATSIEWIKTLQAQGNKTEVDRLIAELQKKHSDNDGALEKIDVLLEEPCSKRNKEFVDKINKEGIDYYNAKDFSHSIDAFNSALQNLPKHIGLRLNLAQALIQLYNLNSHQRTLVVAQQMLDYVSTLILPIHVQYRRFRQLEETLKQCKINKSQQAAS